MTWQPPGHPYQVAGQQRTAAEITATNSPRSTQGIYYPAISPPIYNPPLQPNHSVPSSAGSSMYADGYTYVDQVGHVQAVPVVSRSQVLVSVQHLSLG